LWSPWPVPMTLTDGKLTTTFDVDWETRTPQRTHVITGGRADISLENLTGRYQDFSFRGVNADLHVVEKAPGMIALSQPAAIRIASLNRGVEVAHLELTAQGDWKLNDPFPLVEIRNFRCELLGGVVTSDGARADLAHPPYSATFLARGLDLKEILNLEQQKGLQGTGLLDGTIPVTVTQRGATIQDGVFEARPPGGVVQYQPSADTVSAVISANPNMQLVLQALGNFHYNVLQVGAQYAEDGTLNLKARLEGRNPDLKKTPPVHFNLTIQENIPALLRSLRLIQDIEESIQNRFVGR
ncbi:MAG TPA: YdbH domain-containing protein, partial [Nitrospira sp.]